MRSVGMKEVMCRPETCPHRRAPKGTLLTTTSRSPSDKAVLRGIEGNVVVTENCVIMKTSDQRIKREWRWDVSVGGSAASTELPLSPTFMHVLNTSQSIPSRHLVCLAFNLSISAQFWAFRLIPTPRCTIKLPRWANNIRSNNALTCSQ
jgi:hypothetical protein